MESNKLNMADEVLAGLELLVAAKALRYAPAEIDARMVSIWAEVLENAVAVTPDLIVPAVKRILAEDREFPTPSRLIEAAHEHLKRHPRPHVPQAPHPSLKFPPHFCKPHAPQPPVRTVEEARKLYAEFSGKGEPEK